jgi:hypothetical protein
VDGGSTVTYPRNTSVVNKGRQVVLSERSSISCPKMLCYVSTFRGQMPLLPSPPMPLMTMTNTTFVSTTTIMIVKQTRLSYSIPASS